MHNDILSTTEITTQQAMCISILNQAGITNESNLNAILASQQISSVGILLSILYKNKQLNQEIFDFIINKTLLDSHVAVSTFLHSIMLVTPDIVKAVLSHQNVERLYDVLVFLEKNKLFTADNALTVINDIDINSLFKALSFIETGPAVAQTGFDLLIRLRRQDIPNYSNKQTGLQPSIPLEKGTFENSKQPVQTIPNNFNNKTTLQELITFQKNALQNLKQSVEAISDLNGHLNTSLLTDISTIEAHFCTIVDLLKTNRKQQGFVKDKNHFHIAKNNIKAFFLKLNANINNMTAMISQIKKSISQCEITLNNNQLLDEQEDFSPMICELGYIKSLVTCYKPNFKGLTSEIRTNNIQSLSRHFPSQKPLFNRTSAALTFLSDKINDSFVLANNGLAACLDLLISQMKRIAELTHQDLPIGLPTFLLEINADINNKLNSFSLHIKNQESLILLKIDLDKASHEINSLPTIPVMTEPKTNNNNSSNEPCFEPSIEAQQLSDSDTCTEVSPVPVKFEELSQSELEEAPHETPAPKNSHGPTEPNSNNTSSPREVNEDKISEEISNIIFDIEESPILSQAECVNILLEIEVPKKSPRLKECNTNISHHSRLTYFKPIERPRGYSYFGGITAFDQVNADLVNYSKTRNTTSNNSNASINSMALIENEQPSLNNSAQNQNSPATPWPQHYSPFNGAALFDDIREDMFNFGKK